MDARSFRQTPAGCRLIPARPIPAVKYCDPASPLSSSLKEYSSVPEIVIIAKRENRDNRIVFFFDDLPKGPATIAYRMIAQAPGEYRIPAASASLVYAPEIRATTGFATVRIKD